MIVRSFRESRAANLYAEEHERAIARGHDLEMGWEDTEPHCWIAQCRNCLGWLGLDHYHPTGDTEMYGAGLEPCPGAPPVRPAPRRNPMDNAAAYTGVMLEPREFRDSDPTVPSFNWTESVPFNREIG